jgi:raffinose/stachyose/melibiose transport system permease protein
MTLAASQHTAVDGRTPELVAGRQPRNRRRRKLVGLAWVAPALGVYGLFVLYPLTQTVRYSFYNWDGFGVATPAGFSNYRSIFSNPELFDSLVHAFVLIIFFTVLPVGLGLVAAAFMHDLAAGAFSTTARVVLFVPQILPLVGAGIAWTWMYSSDGLVNQVLRHIGLGSLARPWLGDFNTALPAVGVIGTWVALGFCTILLLSGTSKIDPALYEAARIDGAGRVREFFVITLPGLRREVVVCVTVTVIAALASFDVIYVSTSGGPGYQTMVPGVEIYRLTFLDQKVGQASALGVFLALLVLLVILPIQRLGRES